MSSGIQAKGFVWTFPAVVDKVVDGDTVECHVLWRPGLQEHGVSVRVEGINAIENSQKFGPEATAYGSSLLPTDTPVTLIIRRREKYGRVLAQITLPDGRDFGTLMLAAKASDGVTPLAVTYLP